MDDSVLFEKPKVTLIAYLRTVWPAIDLGPDAISTAGAMGCFEEKSSSEILKKLEKSSPKERIKIEERVHANSVGRGHGSVLDQSFFTFSIENVPRLVTLQLCALEYLSHLQQSLRRAEAKHFYIPLAIKESKLFEEVKIILFEAFGLYNEMKKEQLPIEDARYILPLYTKTNIQTSGDARELQHLHAMSNGKKVEVPSIVKETVEQIIKACKEVAPVSFKVRRNETLEWRPAAQLFASENKTLEKLVSEHDLSSGVALVPCNGYGLSITGESLSKAIEERDEAELSNLKHVHFDFLVQMSLAAYHQAIRQRTWNHSVESIYRAAERRTIIIPPSIGKSRFKERYTNMNNNMLDLYQKLIENGVPRAEAVGVLPHSLQIHSLIHIDGWNAIYSIGKRTCKKAQWEIRKIAEEIARCIKEKNNAFGKYTVPQGIIYGKCPEKNPCGYCDKF
jgi:thymidylate synthase (FAD)